LGGKAPVIVFDDADLDAVVEGIKIGGFFNAGQDCTAATRVIAGPHIYDGLLRDLVPAVGSLKVGDPFADDTEMGPLVSDEQPERVSGVVARAAHGAQAAVRHRVDQRPHPARERDAARRLQAERIRQGHVDLLARGVHADQARDGFSGLIGARREGLALRLQGIRKSYGHVVAADGIDLEVREGEFFTLLGPSGSGKTTLLRPIAGFERPDSGRIELGGRDVTTLPPNVRETNTVFQDYALFPHMSVAENIGYGLKVKGIPRSRRRERVGRALKMVRLEGLENRRPNQLSGGQRQRVALARAVVNEPEVLLLDEPL